MCGRYNTKTLGLFIHEKIYLQNAYYVQNIVIVTTYIFRYGSWLHIVYIFLRTNKRHEDNLNRYMNNFHLYLKYPDSPILKVELMELEKAVCLGWGSSGFWLGRQCLIHAGNDKVLGLCSGTEMVGSIWIGGRLLKTCSQSWWDQE